MRKKFKKLFDFFLCLTATLCLMSCLNSVTSSSNSEKENQPDENTTVLFKGSINIESSLAKSLLSSNSTSRSASPEAIDMSTHEFYVTATSKAGATLNADVVEDPVTHAITFEMPLDFGEWTIETGIRKSADGQKILVDTFEIKLFANTPTFSHAFYLKPVNEGMGSINLEMVVPDNVSRMQITVHSQPDGANFDTAECTASGAAPDRKIILNRENVTGGIYNLVFTYYDVNYNPLFSTIQTINVIPGLETTKWVNGGSSILISNIGKFEVTEALITAWRTQRSTYYVDCNKGYDTYSGGPLDPFCTLAHAVKIINDLYSTEEKTATIIVLEGTTEMLPESLAFNQNKNITIKSSGSGTIRLIRDPGSFSSGPFIIIPATSTFTMENLVLDGRDVEGSGNIGVQNNGTFIMNSGKICGNNNTLGQGGGVYNSGNFELNGGEISGNVSSGAGAGIYLSGTNITISGGIVKNNTLADSTNTPSNLFISAGKKIIVEKAIAAGTDISVSFGWVPKKVKADNAIFTTGYGTNNSTKDPATVFKSDDKYYVIPLTSSSLVEAGIALAGKNFENVFSSYKMTFAMHDPDRSNKFMPSDPTPESRTIQIDPTVLHNDDPITDTVRDSIKWKLSLYYRGGLVGEVDSNVMVIPNNAGYTGRYDLHVYAEYLGLHKDTEYVITGYNNIINIDSDNIQNVFNQLTNGDMNISKDTCINLTTNNEDKTIDLSDTEFYPIGAVINAENRKAYKTTDFEGVLDGNGNTIKLSADHLVSVDFYAICYRNKGTIQNVIIECTGDVNLYENYDSASDAATYGGDSRGQFRRYGGICSLNEGTIRNCWTKANVKGKFFGYIGGICGVNGGLIENCVNTGNFTNMTWGFDYSWGGQYGEAGGITGRNSERGVIRNCVNYGNVELKTKANSSSCLNGTAGAICAVCTHGTSEVKNCYWRENCVKTKSNLSEQNWVVFQPDSYNKESVTNGSFVGNGYFPNNATGSLTAGDNVVGPNQTWTQTLQYGNNLVAALNAYVNAVDPNHAYLKEWEAGDGDGYAALLKQ